MLLEVKRGGRAWCLNYSVGGKRKTLNLGICRDTTLKLAREKADAARKQVAEGIVPSDIRKQANALPPSAPCSAPSSLTNRPPTMPTRSPDCKPTNSGAIGSG